MNKLAKIVLPFATVMTLAGGMASASGGGGGSAGGTWPAAFPLPTNPGTVISQSKDTAAVRSTDPTWVVASKLDDLYVTQKGCIIQLAVNKPKDYLCYNASTHKTDEVYFVLAALDLTFDGTNISQTTGHYLKG